MRSATRARLGHPLAIIALVVLLVGAGGAAVLDALAADPGSDTPGATARANVHAASPRAARGSAVSRSWPRFGRTASRTSSSNHDIGISAADAPKLRRQQVKLPGTVDSAPIFLADARVHGLRRDVFVMTTTYGRTLAVDAASGKILWRFTPRGYKTWAGSYRVTNGGPVASTDRRHVYAAAPDGRIHKLAVSNGHQSGGRWPVRVTRLPEREKLAAPLNLFGGLIEVATSGYIGDTPPYQGHVVTISPSSGAVHGVFNALCASDHHTMTPSRCPESGSAIWSRAGVVRAPDGTLLTTTGDGRFDGRSYYGDSVVRLSRDARKLLGSYTPSDFQRLDTQDVDMGSTGPMPIGGGAFAQSGKDGRIRVVSLARLHHRGRTGGERQIMAAPGGSGMFSAPAVWRHGGRTLVFATTFDGTAAYERTDGKLRLLWQSSTGGTSPIVAGGLLYVYDPAGALVVYRPTTGRRIARLDAGGGHWNSPVPGQGVIALPEGNANAHLTTGLLDLYRRAG